MHAYIPLPCGLSATTWAERYRRGEVPDASPYGLHKLGDHGIDVTFGEASPGRVTERIAASVRYRTDGLELVEGLLTAKARRNADVVLAYDERTGVPATLHATRHRPTVLGIGWLTNRSAAPRLHAAFAHRAMLRAASVFTQCEPVLPILHREWGVPRSRLHYVPVGIDTDFYAIQPEPEPGTAVIASAGEDRYRDHALLVAAVTQLRTKHPGIHLELATGLPVQLPKDIGTLYRGRLDGKMRDLYRRASVVAVALKPTVSGSGLTVALEAMASGRPLVMTANPGVDAYVEHGVTGLLVPPGDVDAFAAAIGQLLSDPARRAEMGAAAAIRARERFTSSLMAANLAALARAV
ncbi:MULTISPECIES: glycosyltransferase family 4 protein [unclassified Mycolicibacterium]|uniref:glycosyltransferase family 4 protein n=1 Tax=unclassified Mycolicibacterium TaxID=2636767 RepID=UPI0012DD1414|nr:MULTISPECIES: glycosyltransferase family 4 protein [unclassified Mycolicibacterium]MUL81736.1 glycosyltransferase family 4 protein [Mycolicibacterium sp. CBMA 329]MUL87502.1 glycosyltransferase family 4 protein [Mycolicibacterium sp. CBMA 331]MUL99633.1 glycosyltransferase family 4 protein [Mycolicibacterium sp. CBMA 334]MUM26730.1 glycosyltransferase family 4 protein [Mycolicibacterium sp. CBMA 295]MUM37799.1 glycosyltransferase family 4 protein [Mycolicibacterium sp. CBMA 247]